MTLKQMPSFSTAVEILDMDLEQLWMCIQNLDIRIKPLYWWVSPKSSKIQTGTFWLYHEQQQGAKGESTETYKASLNFIFHNQTLCSYPTGHFNIIHNVPKKTLSFFSAYISMEKLFLHRLQHFHYTVLLFCLGLHRHLCHQSSWVIHPATWIAYVMFPFPQEENNIYNIISFMVVLLLFFQVHMLSDVLQFLFSTAFKHVWVLCWAKLYVAVSYKDYKPYEEHSLRWVTLLPTKYWSKPLSRNKIDPWRQSESMWWMYILVPLTLNQPILHLQKQNCNGYRLNQKKPKPNQSTNK